MSENKIYEIVQALNQAASNAFPGALDGEGKPREDLPIGKVNNGFKISITANRVVIKYQEELPIQDVQDKNFKGDIEQKMADIVSYLKKEYKKISGETLSLKEEGKLEILIQSLSRFKTFINAKQPFSLSGMDSKEIGEPEQKLDEAIKKIIKSRHQRCE